MSISSLFRCGIAMDCPLSEEPAVDGPPDQPLLVVISSHDFQVHASVKRILSLVKPPNEKGIAICEVYKLLISFS